MTELMQEKNTLTAQLNASLKQLRANGTAFAEAEKQYKILLRQECLKLRDEGMAVTLIDKVCFGIPSIAEARFKRDVAEVVYKANQEAIFVIDVNDTVRRIGITYLTHLIKSIAKNTAQ